MTSQLSIELFASTSPRSIQVGIFLVISKNVHLYRDPIARNKLKL